MKKKLALVLAAAMALTSLPTVAFGKSSNSISHVASAKEDTKFAREGTGNTQAGYSVPDYIPVLEIISDNKIPIDRGSVIRLHLTNAEWLNERDTTNTPAYFEQRHLMPSDIKVSNSTGPGVFDESEIETRIIDSTTMEIQFGVGGTTDVYGTDNYTANDTGTHASGTNGSLGGSADVTAAIPADLNANMTAGSTSGTYEVTLYEDDDLDFGSGVIATIDLNLTTVGDINVSDTVTDQSLGNFALDATSAQYFSYTLLPASGTGNVTIEITPTAALQTVLDGLTGYEDKADAFKTLFDNIVVTWDLFNDADTSGDVTDATELIEQKVSINVYPNSDTPFTDRNNVTGTVTAQAIPGDTVIKIPMLVELTNAGDATVILRSEKGGVMPSSAMTFAAVAEGTVKATVSKTVTIPETGKELENIVIQEVTPGSLKDEIIVRLKAPSNWYWSKTDDAVLRFAGHFATLEPRIEYDLNEGPVTGTATGGGAAYAVGNVEGLNDRNNNEISIRISMNGLGTTTSIGTVIFEGLILKPTDDAKFGDVNVTARGTKFSSTSILVGTYKDYVVTMEPEDKDLPVILAGYFPGYADNSDVFAEEDVRALEVHIQESVPNSWWGLRKTTLSTPDGVEIRGAEIKATKGGNYDELVEKGTVQLKDKGKFTDGEVTIYDGERLEFKGVKVKDDEKAEVWVRLYVSVEPGFTGDIDLVLAGGGMDEDISATVATAVNPVNVSMKQTEIKLGYKNIELNDITITENKAAAIRKDYYGTSGTGSSKTASSTKSSAKMLLQIGDTTDNQYLKFDSIKSYEVTEGDIVLDSVKVRSGNIEIEVKNESDKPSTIVLKGVTGLADRVPPEGYYALSIGGKAVVNNYDEDKPFNGFFETEFFEVPKAYNVITAAPGSANEFNTYVQMKIDDTTMIVGSDTIQMDAAPYISEGRTMLPIRYVANAFGISNDNIHFDQNSKTVTLVTQNRTVQLTVGSRTILSNGTPIEMDVAAEITDGRTFIPVMWVATALGIAQPKWDEATRTVTFNGEYASNDALGSQVQDNSGAEAEVVSTDDANEDEE